MMPKRNAVLAALSLLLAPGAIAGKPAPKEEPKKPEAASQPAGKGTVEAEPDGKASPPPRRTWFPDDMLAGSFTLGTMFSEDATGLYINGSIGIWANEERDAYLFLNTGYHWEDNDQDIISTGLGFRKMLGQNVIVGANVFYDAVNSEHGNRYDQLGLGVEVLTRWVDARFNYYIPEGDIHEVSRSSSRSTRSGFVPGGTLSTTRTAQFSTYEGALEGFNGEVGFLIPGLDKYAEVRAFVGGYHYENPFGNDFEGFKGRLEARMLRGVTANVEYWDDEELMGGHWTAEVAVTVPFSFYNLFTGKNPFEGAGDAFKRLPRPFSDRLADPVDRSHRIHTVTSGKVPTGSSTSRRFTPLGASSGGGGSSPGDGLGFPIE